MQRIEVVFDYSCLKIALPVIMNQDGKSKRVGKIFIKGLCSKVKGYNNQGDWGALNFPEPIFLSIDFYSGFNKFLFLNMPNPSTGRFHHNTEFL